MIWLLLVIYLGFWCGVALGLIAPEEVGWLDKYSVKLWLIYLVMPFFLFLQEYVLIPSLLFLIGFPLGTWHTSRYAVKRKIENKGKMILQGIKETWPYIIGLIIILI